MEQLDKINAELESDVMIRAIHDVKGIDMGNSLVRYKVLFTTLHLSMYQLRGTQHTQLFIFRLKWTLMAGN